MATDDATDPQALIDRLTRDNAALATRISEAEGERDTFRTKYRTTTHKQAAAEAFRAARADPKAVDALWRLHGYDPAGDDVDPEAIAAIVKKAKEESPFAFLKDEPPAAKSDTEKPPPRLNVPGGEGKGGKAPTPGTFQVSKAQLKNGPWMRENQEKVAEHKRAGTLELV